MAWSLKEIGEWLDENDACIRIKGGVVSLIPPYYLEPWRARQLRAEVLPNLKARRAEIIADMSRTPEDLRGPRKPEDYRRETLMRVRLDAANAGKQVYTLWPRGYTIRDGDREPPKARLYGTPYEPTHVCVEGGEWIALPKTLPPLERTKTRKRRKRFNPRKGVPD